MSAKKDYSREAMKALVALHGTRKAARVSGIPYGTFSAYAFRFGWKKASFKDSGNEAQTDAGDVIAEELRKNKKDSTLNLSKYVAKASKKAAQHRDPLDVARKVRDVAGVYQVLYPPEEEGGLIEGAILIGTEKPELDITEIESAKVEKIIDVRSEIQDAGSAGD